VTGRLPIILIARHHAAVAIGHASTPGVSARGSKPDVIAHHVEVTDGPEIDVAVQAILHKAPRQRSSLGLGEDRFAQRRPILFVQGGPVIPGQRTWRGFFGRVVDRSETPDATQTLCSETYNVHTVSSGHPSWP
jgi:hypothetical protein